MKNDTLQRNKYLDFDFKEIGQKGGADTAREIAGQPILWQEVYDLILMKKGAIAKFLSPLLERKGLRIILTGAGSSAFIGEAAQGIVQQKTGKITQAIPTTDLVTHPQLFLLKETPTLMVSFARSGNSPESLEVVRQADEYCGSIYHLIISCNPEGKLPEYAENKDDYFNLLLPEQANDKSLAMTGSFTSMLLSILLLADMENIDKKQEDVAEAASRGNQVLEQIKKIKAVASLQYERVIFLGSGPMVGIARECHLKLQELTDGMVICKHDSFLGFRHGPRVVTNEKSLVVYLFSYDDHVFQYERDLAISIGKDARNIQCVSIGRHEDKVFNSCLTIEFEKTSRSAGLNLLAATMIGQLLGFYKSLQLGLMPDNPSVNGAISRVVQGVKIYPARNNGDGRPE